MPRAAVLLSVRGADPSLRDCLEGLLSQDYPDYDVRIVVDNREDPAWEIVRDLTAERAGPPLTISLLETRFQTCSLKVSALIKAVRALDESYGVVATIDADVIPHPTWLRSLATPLADPAVGAATGVRWYQPVGHGLGTLVRHFWNAAAVTQMGAFDLPWGGSLAYRAELFRNTDLLEQWQHSFCEDSSTAAILKQCGLRLQTVSAATMANAEEIGLLDCCRFIRRQLLCTRLHHPSWPLVLVLNIAFTLAFFGACGWFLAALVLGQWFWAACLAGLLTGFGVGLQTALARFQQQVNVQARQRGEPAVAARPARALLGFPLTVLVYFGCLVLACFLRKVKWRGITYKIGRRADVRLVEYRPYQPPAAAVGGNASLM